MFILVDEKIEEMGFKAKLNGTNIIINICVCWMEISNRKKN